MDSAWDAIWLGSENKQRRHEIMNTLVIVLIAAVCLIAAYALYGRWLAKKWGIDPKAQTPAVPHNDVQG